jgi:phage-related tail fiber protein
MKMAEQFYTILTLLGQAEIAAAVANGSQVPFAYMAIGDGNGAYYEPSEGQTILVHERYRAGINSVSVDPLNPNWIVVEMTIPAVTGGWYAREVGVFGENGNLLAVGKVPETYKPAFSEGAGKDLVIRTILEVSNASAVVLQVDPSVVLASKAYVDATVANVEAELRRFAHFEARR